MNPINKQSAMFLTRKKRVESVTEALHRMADRLLSPGVADEIIEMLSSRKEGEMPKLVIRLKIYQCRKDETTFVAVLEKRVETHIGEEAYVNLKSL